MNNYNNMKFFLLYRSPASLCWSSEMVLHWSIKYWVANLSFLVPIRIFIGNWIKMKDVFSTEMQTQFHNTACCANFTQILSPTYTDSLAIVLHIIWHINKTHKTYFMAGWRIKISALLAHCNYIVKRNITGIALPAV